MTHKVQQRKPHCSTMNAKVPTSSQCSSTTSWNVAGINLNHLHRGRARESNWFGLDERTLRKIEKKRGRKAQEGIFLGRRGAREWPGIRGVAIAAQGEVNGENPAMAAGIVLPQGAEGPLAALELAMHFERDVAGGHRHGQHQHRRHRQKSPHIHVFFCLFFSLFLFKFCQTSGRINGESVQRTEEGGEKWGFMDARKREAEPWRLEVVDWGKKMVDRRCLWVFLGGCFHRLPFRALLFHVFASLHAPLFCLPSPPFPILLRLVRVAVSQMHPYTCKFVAFSSLMHQSDRFLGCSLFMSR